MANGSWKRTTTDERRASRKLRYAHTSVNVAVNKDPITGMIVPTRTPKGEGSTATRLTPKSGARNKNGHDWPGEYLQRPAAVEMLQRARRNAKRKIRLQAQRAAYFASVAIPILNAQPNSEELTCDGFRIEEETTEVI